MSRRAIRGGSNSTSRQGSRENSDNETELEPYSTPMAKRKHHYNHSDSQFSIEHRSRNTSLELHSSNNNRIHSHQHPISEITIEQNHFPSITTITTTTATTATIAVTTTTTTTAMSATKTTALSNTRSLSTESTASDLVDQLAITALTRASIEPHGISVNPAVLTEDGRELHQYQHQHQHHEKAPYSKWSTILHQISFVITGIVSTIAVQWLNYQGAASGSSMLNVFFNYFGMMSVGLVYYLQAWYADRKQRKLAGGNTNVEYDVLTADLHEMTESQAFADHSGLKEHIEPINKKANHYITDHDQKMNKTDGFEISNESATLQIESLNDYSDEEDEGEDEDEDDEKLDSTDEEKQRLHATGSQKKQKKQKKKKNQSSLSEFTSSGAAAAATESKIQNKSWTRLHWSVIQVAVMDVIAHGLVTVGFFYVGSGMYQIIYSSIVIWCAILTRIFLSRKLNNIQWLAIVGVTFGLAISAVGTVQDVSPDGPVQSWFEKSFGALITLGATFLSACVYVLSDKILSTFKPKPIPEKVCTLVGSYASFLTFIYLCVYTIPNWQTEVVDIVETRHGSWIGIIIVYPIVALSSMVHSLNYYVLIARINNIAVGIMQSLRAVLVFVMSHYLFCGVSDTQCFNEWKFISAIVVIGCVTLFSINSPSSNPSASVDTMDEKSLAPKSTDQNNTSLPHLSSAKRRHGTTRSSS